MAFDQNAMVKYLRPLNVARSVAEESRVAAAPTTVSGRAAEGFYASSIIEGNSPQSPVPALYPATVSKPGFGGLGYVNATPTVAGLYPRAAARYSNMSLNPAIGIGYNPSLGGVIGCGGNAVDLTGYTSDRFGTVGVNAADQTSGMSAVGMNTSGNLVNRDNVISEEQVAGDLISTQKSSLSNPGSGSGTVQSCAEGGDGPVPSKKIKFLCSFGGRILPRPSDGMLRYVGGQTRIISVKKDICFNELVQKVTDIYGQPVIMKYQLPDEDLDALVSVSCPDDLDNMMEEYEKLSERSLDGSNKLRIFLFSASELDSTGMVQFGDLNNSGQRYVEAVNGMTDSLGPGIARKESVTSATSTQNSAFSGHEPLENFVPRHSDAVGPPPSSSLSPGGNLAASNDAAKLFFVDLNPPGAEDSNSHVGFPAANSSLSQAPSSQPEDERKLSAPDSTPLRQAGYDLHLPPAVLGVGLPSGSSYMPGYVDPCGENINLATSIPQVNFSHPHVIGGATPIFTPQQYHAPTAGANPHHFISPVHMNMVPAAPHVSMRPPLIQQTQLEHERSSGPKVLLVPIDQSQNAYHLQVPGAVGGGYGWNQVVAPGPVLFSDRSAFHQPSNQSESFQKFEDCHMCQKALPHAHSDTVVLDQKTGTSSTMPVMTPIFHSLRVEDSMKPQIQDNTILTGAFGNDFIEPASVIQSIVNAHGEVPSEALEAITRPSVQKAENVENRKLTPAFPGNESSLDFARVDGIPMVFPQNGTQQQFALTQSQLKQEAAVSKPLYVDATLTGGRSAPKNEQWLRQSPKEYSNISDISSRPHYVNSGDVAIDRKMESLQTTSPERIANATVEDGQLAGGEHMTADFKQNLQGNTTGEMLVSHPYAKHDMLLPSGQMMPIDFVNLSISNATGVHDYKPLEFFNLVQPLNTDVRRSNSQTKMGVHLEAEELHNGNPLVSAVGSGLMTETAPSSTTCMTDSLSFHPTNGASEGSTLEIGVPQEIVEDTSNSLFTNQDPWNLNEDAHLPPPKPIKIALRREPLGNKDAQLENQLRNVGEFNNGAQLEDGLQHPFNNCANINVEPPFCSKAEAKIKQDLQDVAEGVAASVFQSGLPSSPDLSPGNVSSFFAIPKKDMNDNEELQNGADHEMDDNTRVVSERKNFGFPESERIGRLQIIRNCDIEELRELGSGTYGTVYHGKWRGTDVAIKRINDRCFSGKPSEQDRMRNDFWNEAIKLADLHHPNVVAFYGIVLDGPGGSIATVTEYMVNGSLRTALQKNEKNLDKHKRLLIAMDVAFGMEYLHGKSIVHFDLKSDNLLVNLRDPHRPICKVGDLGLSKVKCQTLISGGVRGTLPWMAPELLNGSSSLVSEKVDVFSFGIVMWELLTGDEPYADLHYGTIIGGIVSNTLRPLVPDTCDPEWRSLMERCWSSEQSERPNFTEIADALRCMATRSPTKT